MTIRPAPRLAGHVQGALRAHHAEVFLVDAKLGLFHATARRGSFSMAAGVAGHVATTRAAVLLPAGADGHDSYDPRIDGAQPELPLASFPVTAATQARTAPRPPRTAGWVRIEYGLSAD